MTVKELVHLLSTMPQDREVVMNTEGESFVCEINSVHMHDDYIELAND